jgi:peptide-methionine (S)-S-oxide reductase
VGTQYRSVIFTTTQEQFDAAEESKDRYEAKLMAAGRGRVTTQIVAAPAYYLAEDYHQQYLHRNPGGYCGLAGCGITYA